MRNEYIFLILAMGLVTYFTRATFLVLSKNIAMPKILAQSLKYIPVSILATLIFPAIFIPQGKLFLAISNVYIWAGIITAVAVLITKNQVISIGMGIASLVIIRYFI